MLRSFNKALSPDRIAKLEEQVAAAAQADTGDAVVNVLQPLLRAQPHQEEAARSLISIVNAGHLSIDRAVQVLSDLFDAHSNDDELVGSIGAALQCARDIDMLNDAAPEHPLFLNVVDKLTDIANRVAGEEPEERTLDGLATAARMVARQRDDVAESAYKRLVDLRPDYAAWHYNLGLFYKTRGRFREGMLANQAAAGLLDEPEESIEWNLGICATGAGEAAIALSVWKRMQQKIEMGRFDLPEGGYAQCKVRLAERPLAERTQGDDDPGLEETIWIERLSPCHGIVRSVLFQDLGVDYGDVVLFDGAPVTYHTYGETQVPVFPHLATLVRRQFRTFAFAGTQGTAGQLADSSSDLAGEAIVYSHSENYQVLCANCWRDPDVDHDHHEEQEKHVVRGRIAVPRDADLSTFVEQLDAAIANRERCRIYSPDLCEAADLPERAALERRRFEMLQGG